MISCEQHKDAADNLEVWLENTRLEFSTVCRVDTNCRQALTRMSMNRVMYYRLAD